MNSDGAEKSREQPIMTAPEKGTGRIFVGNMNQRKADKIAL